MDNWRIRLGGSERSFSLVRSFFHSTGSPHERLGIFRAYKRSGVESRESSWNHVTNKRRPAEVEIGLERPVGFEIRLERSIKHVSSSDKYIIVIDFNDTQVQLWIRNLELFCYDSVDIYKHISRFPCNPCNPWRCLQIHCSTLGMISVNGQAISATTR